MRSNPNDNELDDGLDSQVNALPYSITKRYGEIVFAQGGTGYGWWPCQIYDPRLAIDSNVRQIAQKHLYSRYLVYFFNCDDFINTDVVNAKGGTASNTTNGTNNTNQYLPAKSATGTATPFSILAPKMIKSWVVGLSEDLYVGRAAKNHGKQRYRSFRDAFQMACIEHDKSMNNTLIDQKHRYILNSFVYPKMDVHSDRDYTISNAMTPNARGITPEKFLLPSPRKSQPSDSAHEDAEKGTKIANVKKQKMSQKTRHQESIDWFRLPCPSRKRHRLLQTQASRHDVDDIPHPAFAECPKNTPMTMTQDGPVLNTQVAELPSRERKRGRAKKT